MHSQHRCEEPEMLVKHDTAADNIVLAQVWPGTSDSCQGRFMTPLRCELSPIEF
jgi:hypothetical protein